MAAPGTLRQAIVQQDHAGTERQALTSQDDDERAFIPWFPKKENPDAEHRD